jgi:hypothetical protein
MLEKGTKTALQYQLMNETAFSLVRTTAIKGISMVTSSAASERGFLKIGFLHSKLRNRLGCEDVNKLIFIEENAPQLISDQGEVDWDPSDNENITEEDIDD